MLELVLYIFAFIVLSGLMAAIEAAVLSISRGEVKELRLQGAWGADALRAITERITQAVIVLVIFTNTINVLGPILAGRKALQLYGDFAIAVITAVLTLGTIVFSEIIPKSLGTHYAPLISRLAAPVIRLLIIALYPLVISLEWFSNQLKSGERRIGTEVQIRSLATIGRRAGYIESDEGQLVRRAFLLNDRSARDIMTPWQDMVSLEETDTIREAATRVFCHAYSRYPVFGKSINDVTGLVMSRDILEALTEGRGQEPVSTIRLSGFTVPAEMRSDELLVRFRDEHIHLAVVRDQQQTVGLVTLEDVLEELVGDIQDEKDAPV
jgi:CBS domain containing-hemolysin-like protein